MSYMDAAFLISVTVLLLCTTCFFPLSFPPHTEDLNFNARYLIPVKAMGVCLCVFTCRWPKTKLILVIINFPQIASKKKRKKYG